MNSIGWMGGYIWDEIEGAEIAVRTNPHNGYRAFYDLTNNRAEMTEEEVIDRVLYSDDL